MFPLVEVVFYFKSLSLECDKNCNIPNMDLFYELLQVSLGVREELSRVPTFDEWGAILEMAQKQSIIGVLLEGLERLSVEQRPSKTFLLQWIGLAQMIEQNTKKLTKASEDAICFFRKNGFACTLLKGAAVGRYYSNPERRSSGDVDIWLGGGRKKIYGFARDYDKHGVTHGVTYHHIHFHLFDDIHLEAHIWPSYFVNPIYNKRFHKFCGYHYPSKKEAMPCLAFDRVFILLHCYRHHCGSGVGLRQVMDYYYVLKQGFTDDEKKDSVKWIKKLGMYRFASGIMWLLKEVFRLNENYLLMLPDEKSGQFVLQEVMQTGNMGHGDTRSWGSTKSPFSRFVHNIRRDLFLVRHYPGEILWQPWFNIWQYLWSKTVR